MLHLIALLFSVFFLNQTFAEEVVWSGSVNSDGKPTEIIKLSLGKKYKIKVQGSVNLGKWWKQGKPLASDACYEYAPDIEPQKNLTFKNSLNISVCDDSYHENHIYESKPFIAAQNGVHFWIYDIDYSDNSGELKAYIILVENQIEGPSAL